MALLVLIRLSITGLLYRKNYAKASAAMLLSLRKSKKDYFRHLPISFTLAGAKKICLPLAAAAPFLMGIPKAIRG
ncbi:hypothetical protein [Pontibacter actiniarum]|uniref:Uncharacterized protein n=1 Tax=Pontibacter actiniarum TaxID=323450 RepID=A0A1X9YPQ9_9BACT|nr:hypothetical protein [Pontibacter actiniarum]ARS34849.1 hypothetical protein CA264_05015 [Pontibacter actiniarum]